ncbi:hypothetical protein L596_000911 [Steinernema carpocapsae]|uniref:Uncharacterized protein n=1 Tax=Steinernema carpocapsae TaxID=34508 RepID=A0A4U8ULZ1_STECR|nr:hypothetical protein L596_000911 [Steinernema carpocapsae]
MNEEGQMGVDSSFIEVISKRVYIQSSPSAQYFRAFPGLNLLDCIFIQLKRVLVKEEHSVQNNKKAEKEEQLPIVGRWQAPHGEKWKLDKGCLILLSSSLEDQQRLG